MSAIEALYIFDEHNNLILSHSYLGRPPPATTLLPLYLQHPSPRPSTLYLPSISPPTLLYSLVQDNLLFLSPSSHDVEPLLVLEFLHRIAEAFEEFLGSPLLASKITANYDIVAQIVAEVADAGIVCQGEANALRDVVETGPGVLNNLLGKVGLPGGPAPGLQLQSQSGGPSLGSLQRPTLSPAQSSQGSAIPWRRSNVRHTSNELYVDIVETLSVTLAPSGRPIAAFAYGSIAFTSKVSGVPDLLLTLSTGGKNAGMGMANRGDQLRGVMERVVFHPCVRLNRWKSDGVMSFLPPDGRFALCGYEVDLLGSGTPMTVGKGSAWSHQPNLPVPASVEVTTGVGGGGNEFEVRLVQPSSGLSGGSTSVAAASLQSNLGSGGGRGSAGGDAKAPLVENLTVNVPLPAAVRNVTDLRPSKGEAHYNPADGSIEWKVPAKDFGPLGAVLRCSVQGPTTDEDGDAAVMRNGMTATTYDYTDDEPTTEQHTALTATSKSANGRHGNGAGDGVRRELMPTSATLSFSVKGWLASGLKVESLLLDTKKSRGLGAEIKPYKGVKYLTVSRGGVVVRC
ncbi:hypothetical protein BAUCODRAFT_134290 [Baudoinia panamericana UAMH 10762]|uniref:MHD domain-containing protein n=1 Tax=Baudoinia panamericana (strain UAMH 10762) TaxID=717646 RepID=M2N0K4_BAUPA|nr:uncharacterized protein BAUCODRAFT_134290 [Baudoinia panamericana UAMH 10762]EMC92454.1 hypothetical protein BAUCODRAFT_134290 [Baudoinia panamericana UAMH 10762]